MKERPSALVTWEELHIGVQIAVSFVLSVLILWVLHIGLLNQPNGRGFLYGLFWAVPLTVIVVGATRAERAKRLRARGSDRAS